MGAQLSPESAEEYIEYLKSSDRLDEAAQRLATVVNDERFVSKAGKSNYQVGLGGTHYWLEGSPYWGLRLSLLPVALQLWHELCDLISQNPDKVQSLNVDAIIRGGLTRFTDQLGKLWCSLADYYIRSGHFEKVHGLALFWVGRGLPPVPCSDTCEQKPPAICAHTCALHVCLPEGKRRHSSDSPGPHGLRPVKPRCPHQQSERGSRSFTREDADTRREGHS